MDKALSFKIGADIADLRKKMGEAEGLMSDFKDKLGTIAAGMAAAFTVDKVLAFGKASVTAAAQAIDGENRLLAGLKGRIDIQQRLLDQADKLHKTTLFEDDEIIKEQALLAVMGRTESQITKIIQAAVEFKTALGPDVGLGQVVEALNKAMEGNNKALFALDPTLRNVTELQLKHGDAVGYVLAKYQGLAEGEAGKGSGPIKQYEKALGELQETIGREILPKSIPAIKNLTAVINVLSDEDVGRWKKLAIVWASMAKITSDPSSIFQESKSEAFNLTGAKSVPGRAAMLTKGLRAPVPGVGGPGKPKKEKPMTPGAVSRAAIDGMETADLVTGELSPMGSPDMFNMMSQAAREYGERIEELTEIYQHWGAISSDTIASVISGQQSLVGALGQTVSRIVDMYEKQAVAAAIASAALDGKTMAFPWAKIATIIAVSGIVKGFFSKLGGTGGGGAGGYAGGGGQTGYSNAGSVITESLGSRIQLDVRFQKINGTDLKAVETNQTRIDNKVKGTG